LVTSMRVPSSLARDVERAKTEWDSVLLCRPRAETASRAWDVCLLVEVKASADAATTDFPRLLRGLDVFAKADYQVDYSFTTRQGATRVRGASLCDLAS